jgi:hypothetical protein
MSKYIIDNQYFACIGYYSTLFNNTDIEIEQFENWEKMSFRNRCMVAGSNGLIHLTVPVENGRNQHCLFKDIKINNRENWQLQHWRTIQSCYGKAPFFEYYQMWLESFLLEKKFIYLFDMNLEILNWVLKTLKTGIKPALTTAYQKQLDFNIIDYRKKWSPKTFQLYPVSQEYFQLFNDKIGFQHNLSILDLLLCEGPNAFNILTA